MTECLPVSRKCLYCKELIYITEPVDKVTCPGCGEILKVVEGRTIRLSKICETGAKQA